MRIIGIAACEFSRTLSGTAWNPVSRWRERRAPILRLTASDGITGIGEGWSRQQDIAAFFERLRLVAPLLLGADPLDPAGLSGGLPAAAGWAGAAVASAIDMALWDMRAKREGRSLHAALGGTRRVVPVYASGGLYVDGKGPEALAAEMAGYVAQGFTGVKMKIGALSFAEDHARVRIVRQAIGPRTELFVDAVNQLDRDGALLWSRRLADLGVAGLQAPLPFDDIEGMAMLQRQGPVPVIASEAEFRPEVFQCLLREKAVGMLQFCVGLCGGPSRALALIAEAAAHGVTATPQCHATVVLQAASLHLGGAHPNAGRVEFHMFHDHLHDLLPPGMRAPRAGCLSVDGVTGLGIAPEALDAPRAPDTGEIRALWSMAA
ncbi:mandelate racemase/muconate lactonizing enzyme family protein [Plastoroseomonas hellenica]|uniref:mandelate racemase/muconate lactonizing enzyme family protein n=1 Tax=Plastoroseomonas hellenica TaxID=2687306 RepID=UPI001BA8D796|nr:mandelate racemase/muconate lactonizing enzyme family protein [Plastoroseomonas hellenica]MBR0641523.1 mandelate racemase/muconate lactonizing enzyme family protein [Plastoroseomonas hellenica]